MIFDEVPAHIRKHYVKWLHEDGSDIEKQVYSKNMYLLPQKRSLEDLKDTGTGSSVNMAKKQVKEPKKKSLNSAGIMNLSSMFAKISNKATPQT